MKPKNWKPLILGVVIVAVIIAIILLSKQKPQQQAFIPNFQKQGTHSPAPELSGIDGWINSPPLNISSLKGKVVIVDFWTYSCINCLRTLPYLNAWHTKYNAQGLVIIGVHTPEFEFEKKYDNVALAVKKYGIQFPVALDNEYITWNAYQNQYWPRKYIIDKEGNIRYDHIGEGAYDETEQQIQELLSENGPAVHEGFVNLTDQTPTTRNTPEIYLGYASALPRGQNIGNFGGFRQDQNALYALPKTLQDDVPYLEGPWIANRENIETANTTASSIYLQFSAKSIHIVAEAGNPTTVYITIDGKLLDAANAGDDVQFSGNDSFIVVKEPRLYTVYRGAYGKHTLKLTINNPGFSANSFTFG